MVLADFGQLFKWIVKQLFIYIVKESLNKSMIGDFQGAKLGNIPDIYTQRFTLRIWVSQEPVCSTRTYSEVP
jgi:hypothetical protein